MTFKASSPLRAALYACYSSDLQRDASIEDQLRLCRKLCADNGWIVTETFQDRASSGSFDLRPGFQGLRQAAMHGGFDVVVAEALDRFSRDQEHIAGFHKKMSFHCIVIVTKTEGEIKRDYDKHAYRWRLSISSILLKRLITEVRQQNR